MTDLVHRAAFILLLAFTLNFTLLSSVEAAPSCRQLEAQLARASSATSSKATKKYDAAIVRQRGQIEKTRLRTRKAGCGFAVFSRNRPQCEELNAALKRMEANLKNLTATRAGLAKTTKQPDRSRILAALKAGGCRSQKNPVTQKAAAPARDMVLPPAKNADIIIRGTGKSALSYPANRPYLTQCVRICDGYFFPMSKSSTPADFQRDQARCEAACPGTRVEMFYGGSPEKPANMISAVTGKPYTSLPKALVFRRLDIPTDPGCHCGSSSAQASSFFGEAPIANSQLTKTPGSSLIRMQGSTDSQKSAQPAVSQPSKEQNLTDERKVRVVGPVFLPAR
ncbi:DUF2865 domain-containing protein [Aquamicrobium segne]|uniref:DUF2865 domain-containing protein n=1 Tax=Aquamicrobium segne TaxID=469547 RepID=A0ABW0H1I6_9HYPH